MKIGIYKDTLANRRGADIAVRNLAEGLHERGYDVVLFEKHQLADNINRGYDILISAGTNEILDLSQFTVLPPIVQQFHTDPAYPFRHWIKRFRRNHKIRVALRRVAAIQVLRQEHIETLDKLRIHSPRTAVIGNWSHYGNRSESPEVKEEKIILCPGAINKDKNQILLIKAFSVIADEFPGWEVHVYGEGKYDFPVLPRVKLMGYADLSNAYNECAFVAFPSKTEGFPLILVDAANFSKHALCIHDWIGCGLVVDGTVDAFAAGLRRLMGDEEFRRSLGRQSREYCAANYGREKILDQWESLLKDMVRQR